MGNRRYVDKFNTQAVRRITDRDYPVKEVAGRLSIASHNRHAWLKREFTATRRSMPASASHCLPVPVTPTRW